MTSFEGKVVAITGAASGIGLATAHLLASRGASVSLGDIQQERLAEVATEIQKSNPKTRVFHKVVNVVKADEVASWLDETVKELGGLHGAANLAGVLGTTGARKISEMEDEDWDFVMDVNLRGVFNCVRAELQRMSEGASIVNAASVAGLRGYPKGAAYSTSKHGVVGLTKNAALEEGTRNIRVNCIAPGPINTPMIHKLSSVMPSIDSMKLAIRRKGQPEEVAKLIAFLLSEESSYTTGSCYEIDGGNTA